MPVFAYAATDQSGKIVRGRYEAENAQLAATSIEKNGYTVAALEQEDGELENEAVTIVNTALMGAICEQADAIRIEPGREGARVFFGFAGEAREQQAIEAGLLPGVTEHLKMVAGIDPVTFGSTSSGGAKVEIGDQIFELCFDVSPVEYGEQIAIRILESGVQ